MQLGAHTSTAGGISNAITEGAEIGCDVVQVFTKNQRQWKAPPLDTEEVKRWYEAVDKTGVRPAMSHASYLINFAARDRRTLWRSRYLMLDELDRAERLGIPYVVVHPGAHLGAGVALGVERVARALDWIAARRPHAKAEICLENTAGQGTTLGRSFDELGAIVAARRSDSPVGICLDTCHLFAAGYDLRSDDGLAATLDGFHDKVGLDRLRCLHLNDSKHGLGSKRDRHAHIGAGELGEAAFAGLLAEPRLHALPAALETPVEEERGYAQNLALLRDLAPKAKLTGRKRPPTP